MDFHSDYRFGEEVLIDGTIKAKVVSFAFYKGSETRVEVAYVNGDNQIVESWFYENRLSKA